MIPENDLKVHKKPDRPEKAENPAILSFLAYLSQHGYIVNLKPIAGRNVPVIEVAA
jgi:hypothetical protein